MEGPTWAFRLNSIKKNEARSKYLAETSEEYFSQIKGMIKKENFADINNSNENVETQTHKLN